jgi:hypothetical protein
VICVGVGVHAAVPADQGSLPRTRALPLLAGPAYGAEIVAEATVIGGRSCVYTPVIAHRLPRETSALSALARPIDRTGDAAPTAVHGVINES